jgi:hypothetical protein
MNQLSIDELSLTPYSCWLIPANSEVVNTFYIFSPECAQYNIPKFWEHNLSYRVEHINEDLYFYVLEACFCCREPDYGIVLYGDTVNTELYEDFSLLVKFFSPLYGIGFICLYKCLGPKGNREAKTPE